MDNVKDESFALYLVKEYAKQAKRLFILLVISILINIFIIGMFLMYLSQYDFTGYEVKQDGKGINNFIGGDGDNINGADDTQTNENTEKWKSKRDSETKAERCINLILALQNIRI